jgi:hypothetical protein
MLLNSLDSIFRELISLDKIKARNMKIDFSPEGSEASSQGEKVLVADASQFPPEGDESFAHLISEAYRLVGNVFSVLVIAVNVFWAVVLPSN